MIRKFAFVIFDKSDQIIDRYNLDLVDSLSGLGFSLNLDTIETDIEDYVTRIRQRKQNLGLTVHHLRGYQSSTNLKKWLAIHINDCLCIEYTNSAGVLYIEGKVTNIGETDLNEFKVLEQTITFQPLTPFFEKIDNDIRIQISDKGKSYPFKYPYCYGKSVIENNEIENTYIKDIPLIITIFGSISNPKITLSDDEGTYNLVEFENVSVGTKERLIINSAQKKIILIDAQGEEHDYYPFISSASDSYLRARALKISRVGINLMPRDSGYLIGSRRQYKLWLLLFTIQILEHCKTTHH